MDPDPLPAGDDTTSDLPEGADLFEFAPVALSLISLDGRQLRGNAAYRELFGLTPDRLGRVDALTITHPSDVERTRSYLRELAHGSRDRVVEEKLYVRADGTVFTGRLTARRMSDGAGRPVALLGVIEDVTVESAQRTEIDQAHRRLRAMLENISDTITLIDADGRVMDTTGLHTSVMGYDPDFWEGRSLYDLTVPEDRDALVAAHRTVLENPGLPVQQDLRVVHSDGSLRDLEVTAVNLLDDPAVGGIVITSRNITDRKRVEAELARRRDEALEESRMRSELVARVSHELRNQLHAVRGLTELLSAADVPRSARELADSAHRQAEQFSHLVDDLLEYSRMEAGREEPRSTPTLVRQIVADSAALGSRLARAGVTVLGRTSESVPDLVQVDDARIRQVLANLVSNAAKFTDEGQVCIDLERGLMGGRPSLRFTVTDTGVGIDPADLDRIFRPFDQGSRGDPSQGTGLGLSITERAVALLGGRIEVRSEPGRGSAFIVEIPVGESGSAEDAGTAASPGTIPLRVLVVEDNEVNQLLVAEQLRRLGARPTVVGTGDGALAALGGGRPFDCVLMDWQLPGIDGLETTRRIRAGEDGPRLPIIGITASAQASDRQMCLEAGMDDLLVKPVGIGDLAETLGRVATDADDASPPGAADLGALDRLADELGSTGPVRSIVRTYLGELDHRRAAVHDGIASGDDEQVRRTAHTLRSTSATLGAAALDAVSARLERDEFPPPDDLVDEFDRAAEETRRVLEDWLRRHPAPG